VINELARSREEQKQRFSTGRKQFSQDLVDTEVAIIRRRKELIDMVEKQSEELLGQ